MKHILQKILPLALALALLCSLAPAALAADPVPVMNVKLSATALTVVEGYSEELIAEVEPLTADQHVTWTVTPDPDDPGAVETDVSTDSLTLTITGKTAGKVKITATSVGLNHDGESAVAACAVTVATPVDVTGVTLSSSSLNLVKGNTASLTARIAPSNATDQTVKWEVIQSGDTFVEWVETSKDRLTYTFKGVKAGKATIIATTEDGSYTAQCVVTVTDPIGVTGVTLSSSTLSIPAGETRTLTATVAPGDATDKTVKWTADSENVSLSAETGASVTVTARRSGSAKVTATTVDGTKTAECAVTVTATRISASLSDDRLDFSSLAGTLRTYCRNITGASLSYLANVSVSTAQGTLYEGYISEADHGEGVSSSQKYYDNDSGDHQLRKITFIPRIGFTGDAVINFTAYSVTNDVFTGSIVVGITGASLSYTTEDGSPVCFQSADFTTFAQTMGYGSVRYVRFTLPASRYGTLYYNYIDSEINEGPVSAATSYHRTGYPYLDKVWFVPNPGYSGNVTIYFTAWDNAGTPFSGTILVQVTTAGSSLGSSYLSYSVRPGGTVWFSANDFNSLSYDRTDYPLNYLYFPSLPLSRTGRLYCSGYGSVGTNQYFYRAGSNRRLVSDVYFTASDLYTGMVSIPFTAYATNGARFSGTVTITVSTSAGSAVTTPNQGTIYDTGSMITYSSGGEAVAFRSQDFYNEASRQLSAALSTVEFYAPDASQGRLCLNYVSPTSYSVLDSSTAYPASMISAISFLPRAGFSGAAYIRFVASDQSGKSYAGTMAVNVAPSSVSNYFDDMRGYSWAAPSVDFLARSGIVTGTDYRTYSPAGLTRRGDFILMLQRCFDFPSIGDYSVFKDVSVWSYYGPAIAGAYTSGLATGDGDGNFRPADPLTRQEASVLFYRCLRRSGSLPSVTTADLAGFSDQGRIAPYAQTAMATLVRLGVLTGDAGLLNPTQFLTRAEMALMFHRALT